MAEDRLTRDPDGAMLGGVFSGIGRRYGYDPTLLRVVAVIITIPAGGLTIPLYLAAWIIIPRPDQVQTGASRPSVPPRGEAMDELNTTARRAIDRLSESARAAAEAARTAAEAARAAAEEVADLAHRPRDGAAPATGAADGDAAPPEAPAPPPQPEAPRPPFAGDPPPSEPTGGAPPAAPGEADEGRPPSSPSL